MENEYKYFIEHKELKSWLKYNGDLTNDPNQALSFDSKWKAEGWLKPQSPTITSDFSGRNVTTDYTFVWMHENLKKQIAAVNNGADLYTDFVITEHLFV